MAAFALRTSVTRAMAAARLAASTTTTVARRTFKTTAATLSGDRPFRTLGIQQIALGGESKDPLKKLWSDLFGIPVVGTFSSESENVNEDILRAGVGPMAVEVDIMEPLDIAKRPAVHKPALNHVGVWVDDIHAAVTWLEGQGVRFAPGGIRKGAAGYDVTFIHPKGNHVSPVGGSGVLVELVQAPPEVVAHYDEVKAKYEDK